MTLRKPIKIEVLEELHDRFADLRERSVALGWQPHDVYEHALFFGFKSAAAAVEGLERQEENARNARRLHEAAPLDA